MFTNESLITTGSEQPDRKPSVRLSILTRIAVYPQASLRADRASAIAALGQSLPDGFAGEESLGLASLADPEIGEALARYASGDRPEPPVPAG